MMTSGWKHTVALTFLLNFALVGHAQAATKFPPSSATGFDAKVLAKDHAAPKTARKPSDDQQPLVGEVDLPEDFKKAGGFRDRFLKVNVAEGNPERGLAEFLDKARSEYGSYSPSVKFFVAQLETIRPLRAIVYRMRKLSEKNKTMEASAVVMMKSIASAMKIYLPTDQWKAGWDYVTRPSAKEESVNRQFQSIAELQAWAAGTGEGDLAQALTEAADNIAAIYKERAGASGLKPLVLDNILSYGTGTFPEKDGLDRYRTFDNPELLSALATLELSLHSIKVFAAYNQEQFFEYFAEAGRVVGVGQILDLRADVGLSACDRNNILFGSSNFAENKAHKIRDALKGCEPVKRDGGRKYDSFLRLYPDGEALMVSAGEHLGHAVKYLDQAWDDMQPLSDSGYAWIDPGKVKPSKREISLRLANMKAMVEGPKMLRSPITGERVWVNLPKIFTRGSVPQDLKEYFATGFRTDIKSDDVLTAHGVDHHFRNYDHGRATGWNQLKWRDYVRVVASNAPDDREPDASSQTPASMGDALKILRQTWGGDYISPVLDFVIR